MGHLVIEGDQVGEAGPASHEAMLAGPDHLVVLHMHGALTQDELLHILPLYQGQAGRPVLPWILLLSLRVDGCHISSPPVAWDLSCYPGLLINDGEWLGKLLGQLPQRSQVDPIQPIKQVIVQVEQQVIISILLDYRGSAQGS